MRHCIYCNKELPELSVGKEYLFPVEDYPEDVRADLAPLNEPDDEYNKYLRDMRRNGLDPRPRGRILDWDEVRELVARGTGIHSWEEAEKKMQELEDGGKIAIPVGKKKVFGYQICSRCHNVLPEIGEKEPVFHIGFIASRSAGKSVLMLALAANQLACLNNESGRFAFKVLQSEAKYSTDRTITGQRDILHDEFMRMVHGFEQGYLPGPTERITPHPFLVRVTDRSTSRTAVLFFYDCPGEYFERQDLEEETELYYLHDLTWIFLLLDPRQVFPEFKDEKGQFLNKQAQLTGLLHKVNVHWEAEDTKPGMSLVVTQADDIGDECLADENGNAIPAKAAQMLRSRIGEKGYDPELECVRKHYLSTLRDLKHVRGQVHDARFKVIQENMISATGCGVKDGVKTDPQAKPQYLAEVICEMLMYLFDNEGEAV